MFAHQVVAGLNRKEPRAREWVYKYYYNDVLKTVRAASSGSPDAADLASAVFLKLYDHPGTFDSIRSIKQLLFTTARNTGIDHLKHREVVQRKTSEIEKYYRALEEEVISRDAICDAFDEMMDLAAKKLSHRCRLIITLCFTYGEKNHEIARRLGISEKTVEYHKTAAYKKLKLEFEKSNRGFLLNFLL